MFPISAVYEDYLRRHDREFMVKADINGTIYDNTKIVDFEIENSLALNGEFELGTVIPNKLTMRLRTQEAIPANARITPYLALSTSFLTWAQAHYNWADAGITWAGGGTDWLPLGDFYVDSRERAGEVWTFTAYDKLVWADSVYVSGLSYPASQRAVWNEICGQLGYTYDSSVVINPGYVIPTAPTGYSMRQVLGYIASANAACIFVGKDGKLRFGRFSASMPVNFNLTAADYIRVRQTNPVKSYSRVVVTVDDENDVVYEAGSGDENHTLYVANPLMTQAQVNALQATLNGFAYLPITMDARGFPHLDQGDVISYQQDEGKTWLETQTSWAGTDIPWSGINTYQSIILHQVLSFKGGLKMTIEAPSSTEQQSEFPVAGPLTQAIDNLNKTAVKEGKLYYGAALTREDGLTIARSDGKAKAVFNADELSFYRGGDRALWFDVPSNKYKFSGTLEGVDGVFSGSLSAATGTFAGSLQAATGTFAGSLSAATGTFAGDLSAAGGTFAGDLSAAGGTFRGNLSAAGGTFSGALQAASGSFTGTLQAASGSFSGTITASTITGSLVQTSAPGTYPRAEMSSSDRSFSVWSSEERRLQIHSYGSYAVPDISFNSGNNYASMFYADGVGFAIASNGLMGIEAMTLRLHGYNAVSFLNWSGIMSEQTGFSLQSELDTKASLSESGYNMVFDTTTRNLKLFSKTGALLAQVNIPK